MDGLFLLYLFNFAPVSGPYGPSVEAARKAAFIQSGIAADWAVVQSAAEKRIPPVIRHAAVAAGMVHRRELELNSRVLKFKARPDGASALLTLEW